MLRVRQCCGKTQQECKTCTSHTSSQRVLLQLTQEIKDIGGKQKSARCLEQLGDQQSKKCQLQSPRKVKDNLIIS